MVADVNDPSNNKMRGVIKIPVMKRDQRYIDWKKELQVWEATNTVLEMDVKLQAALLFESLEGVDRQIVLSELTASEIIAEDGLHNIIKTLDYFFMENETHSSSRAIDALMQYKLDNNLSIQDSIAEFQIKVNRVKESGMFLSDVFF